MRGIDSCPTPTPPFIRCNPLRNRLGILFIPLIFFSGYLNDDIYCCCFFAPPSLLKKKLRCTKKNLNFGEISNAIVFFSPALLLHRPYVSMAIFIVFYFHPPQCYFLQNPLPPTPAQPLLVWCATSASQDRNVRCTKTWRPCVLTRTVPPNTKNTNFCISSTHRMVLHWRKILFRMFVDHSIHCIRNILIKLNRNNIYRVGLQNQLHETVWAITKISIIIWFISVLKIISGFWIHSLHFSQICWLCL